MPHSAAESLINQTQSLLIASKTLAGDADISYAPYWREGNRFYIFISRLARHSQNLRQHRQAALLFIQPEQAVSNPFARQRLTLNCTVTEIDRQHEDYLRVLDAMSEQLGGTMALLRSLPDFDLLALTLQNGQLVLGFGQAWALTLAETGDWQFTPAAK